MSVKTTQSEHFDELINLYELHYDDKCSQNYREKFIYSHLFEGIKLENLQVLEAMCGSGQTTSHLLSQGAKVTGLDVSRNAIFKFRERWPECNAVVSSIDKTNFKENSFDLVVIVGGLHHVPDKIDETFKEIFRILKPAGYFCFVEPHEKSFLNLFRRIWYRNDDFFTKTERAINIECIMSAQQEKFDIITEKYGGGVAYLLVLNSMIFRVPPILKKIYTPILFFLENSCSMFLGKRSSLFVVCKLRKAIEGNV